MACAMPIIASAKGETARIISEADCGMCSDIGDAKELAENICKMAALSKERLMEMSENAKIYNDKNFNKKQLMDQMDSYLR